MRKFSFFILAGILINFVGLGQVTVTNPANTSPPLAATYPSLVSAITALNGITAISGPVVITLNAGNPETAPAGGYVIQFTATTSSANNIIIEGSANTITAFTPQTVGNLNDGIFKLVGADHITIQNFIMQENAANIIVATAESNNMTEWGVALLRASLTDGAQNNTIQNNTISLNIAYRNTFGIYSNAVHAATTPLLPSDATAFSGSNSGNKVYNNVINNVMMGITFIGTGTTAFQDAGNDVGGSSVATGNSITDWGGNTPLSTYASNPDISYCIYMNNQVSDNVSYNILNSGSVGAGVSTTFAGIRKEYTTAPSGTFTSTISNNAINMSSSFTGGNLECIRILGMNLSTATMNITNNLLHDCAINTPGTSSAFMGIINTSAPGILNITNNTIRGLNSVSATGGFTGIQNAGAVGTTININDNKLGDAITGAISYSVFTTAPVYGIYNTQHPVTCSVSISNNDIRGIVHSAGSSSVQYYIANMATGQQVGNLVINGNTFTNLSVNTSGSIAFIAREGHMPATGSSQCSNNSIVGSFTNNNAATAGNMYFYYVQNIPSVNGSVVTVTGNNFSNVTVNGPVSIQGYYDLEGVSNMNGPAKTYTGNVMNNITMGTGTIYAMYMTNSGRVVCSTNVVSNITTGGFIAGIWHGSTNGQGPDHVSNNTVSNLASGSANVVGIMAGSSAVPNLTVSGNVVSGLSSAGTTNVQLVGIEIIGGQTINVSNNLVNNIQGSGSGASTFAYGIRVNTGTAVQVYQNKIYDVRHVGTTTAPASSVIGIQSVNPANLTVYNNFIADLKAPNSGQADAIRGININALGANTTYKLYYNSVYINAASSGTNFGTSGIFHTGHAIATTGRLEMINNIIVNTSTANGTGITAAFRRSNTTLTNYAAASDHNLFYAGTPSANRVIFYDGTNSDQTLAVYQARVATREVNSTSSFPNFTSSTDLHLTPNNCGIDNMGTPIGGFTNDIDTDTRSTTMPDIGADEFDAYNPGILAGIVSTAICANKAVVNTGTIYTDAGCNLIARVLPSGGVPVTGMINACVTLDATPQSFNGEPYVQRHYDIEPATSPATATATITLYYTNTEFINYNTANPVWPALPTFAADPNIANLKVTQFHGVPTGGLPTSTPGNYSGSRVLLAPVSVILNGSIWEVTVTVAGFSGFYVHSNIWNAPLPITVNYFTGTKQGSNHLLNWKVTCTSTPRATMTLERSADSKNFSAINSITADAIRCQQPFDYTDTEPLKGMNYYRLRVTDADGKISYSSTVALLNAIKGFDIISIAPNPVVTNNFTLNVSSAEMSKMELLIIDMQGRLVQRQTFLVIAGFNSLPLQAGKLAAGTYTLQANIADEKPRVMRFVKQ